MPTLKPTEVFFPFKFDYLLSPEGQRFSLLSGGDGRKSQSIDGQITLADADALGVSIEWNGKLRLTGLTLKSGLLESRRKRLEEISRNDFLDASYDEPLEFSEALADALRYQAEQMAVIEVLNAEREVARQAALAGEAEIDMGYISPVRVRYNSRDYEIPRDAELDALIAELKREAEERDAQAKAEREAEEEARRVEKVHRIAEWLAQRGTENQRERFAAGLFPEREALTAIEEDAFARLAGLDRFERITPNEVRETCVDGCRCYYGDDCRVTCKSEDLDTVSAEEWDQIRRIKALLPQVTITPRLHSCVCDSEECDTSKGEGVIERKGIYVKLQYGVFTFVREYAME